MKKTKQLDSDTEKGLRLLEQAKVFWDARYAIRQKRKRAKRYLMGEQWSDLMVDPFTEETLTEKEFIEKSGRLAIQNNLLRPIVFNLIGQYRQIQPSPTAISRSKGKEELADQITGALRYALDLNDAKEIDASEILEMALSGTCAFKTRYKWMPDVNRADVSVEIVDQTRLFHNTDLADRRMRDLYFVGEIHDYSMDEIISDFAKDKQDEQRLREIYGEDRDSHYIDYMTTSESQRRDSLDFFTPYNLDKKRVIEVWVKEYAWVTFAHDYADGRYYITDESMEDIAWKNQARIDEANMIGIPDFEVPLIDIEERYEPMWNVYFLSPYGEILYHAQTPYKHELCPYDLGIYPFIDGEAVGLVESIIDQQRQFNRLLSLLDQSIQSSNKGFWMIPKSVLGNETEEDWIKKTTSYGNYVFYDDTLVKAGTVPQHFHGQSIPVGAGELANLQKDLMKEISGVVGSIQGLEAKAGTPASLYAQQVSNASTTQNDIFQYYNSVLRRRNKKISLIQREFYEETRFIKTASFTKAGFNNLYDPIEIMDMDFDVVMTESTNNPVYRQMIDDYLLNFVTAGLIPFEDFLETTSLPFSQALLQKIKERKEQMMNDPMAMGAVDPQTQQLINRKLAS